MGFTQGKNLDALLTLSKKRKALRKKAFDDYLFSNLIIYPETFFQLKAAKAKATRYRKLEPKNFFSLQVKVGGGDFLQNNVSFRFYEIEPF